MRRRETLIALSILILATATRFFRLGDAPLFFDESVHWVIAKYQLLQGSYAYDPRFHGPLLFYTISPAIALMGDSEFSLRLIPAILGVLLVASVFLFRRYVGEEAFLAALLVAIAPLTVNYSRFCREDVYQLLFTSLFLYSMLRYMEPTSRKTVWISLAFLNLALFACVKETFYFFAPAIAVYFAFDFRRFRVRDVLAGAAIFLFVYLAFYTNFFSDLTPLLNLSEFPAVKAVTYWKGQHEMARIAGPWYYHLELLLLYDAPAFSLAFITVGRLFGRDRSRIDGVESRTEGRIESEDDSSEGKKGSESGDSGSRSISRNRGKNSVPSRSDRSFTALIAYVFLANLLFYSYVQEKVPWLAVHVEFPMMLLAARSAKAVGWKAVIPTIIFLAYGCIAVNFVNPVNPAEPALYLPTQYDVKSAQNFTSSVLYTDVSEYYPLVFYLKSWRLGSLKNPDLNAEVVIANETSRKILEEHLNGWREERMVVRCWTFWTTPDLSRVPRFLLLREPLSEVYCMNFSVFKKLERATC